MNTIDPIRSTTAISPVSAPNAARGVSVFPVVPQTRATDNASGLPSGSSLKVLLAGPHAESNRLFETARAVDVADQALSSAQGLLNQGIIDPILNSLDKVTGSARAGGISFLHEGTTLKAGGSTLDVRPVSTNDLGAVIEFGRSHRLADLRAGGPLDARANPDAARRSTQAAITEVAAVRSQLQSFGTASVGPAIQDGLAVFRSITGASPVTTNDAPAIRAGLLGHALSAPSTLTGSSPEGVLRLLG
jgi:hypothetical protein